MGPENKADQQKTQEQTQDSNKAHKTPSEAVGQQ